MHLENKFVSQTTETNTILCDSSPEPEKRFGHLVSVLHPLMRSISEILPVFLSILMVDHSVD